MSARKSRETGKERKKVGASRGSSAPDTPAQKASSRAGNGGNGAEELRARIARRAYELYAERGYKPGYDFDDWIRAEREILGR